MNTSNLWLQSLMLWHMIYLEDFVIYVKNMSWIKYKFLIETVSLSWEWLVLEQLFISIVSTSW